MAADGVFYELCEHDDDRIRLRGVLRQRDLRRETDNVVALPAIDARELTEQRGLPRASSRVDKPNRPPTPHDQCLAARERASFA